MSEYGSAFFKVSGVSIFFRVFIPIYLVDNQYVYPLPTGKTIGTPRSDGFGQLLIEARAEDGQVRATASTADENGQGRHGTPTASGEHG